VDYEFRIKSLERETAHLKEMQELSRERHDTSDERLTLIQEILATVGQRLQELVGAQNNLFIAQEKLTLDQSVTEQKLQQLIDIIIRGQQNGHGKS
jgi:hypothetical protein